MTAITDPTRGASDPGRLWTLTNMSEATPEVLSPLCWSVWGDHLEPAARAAWAAFGILPRRAVHPEEDPNRRIGACFFGRQAMNVDVCRVLMGSVPGTSAEEFERDILGFVRADAPPVPNSKRRLPFIAVKSPAVLTTQTRAVAREHAAQYAWWRHEVYLGRGELGALARLEAGAQRFERSISIHIRTRFLVQGLQAQVMALAARAGLPELGPCCFSGFGGLEETAIAQELWDVSRSGSDGGLEHFIERYGFHGPAEGNPISRSWREEPRLVRFLVEGLASRTDGGSPRDREGAAAERRRAAEAAVLAQIPARRRAGARLLFRLAATHIRNLELGKAAFLMAIDGCRAAARLHGADLVRGGILENADDVFYLTIPELHGGSTPDWPDVVAFRRARREEYRLLEVPVTFTGTPEPVPVAPATVRLDQGASIITGAPGGPGEVEGRAQVVLDPGQALHLDAGSILVCRFTDPSWAPVFMLADGLVIDLGGPASHGAIVARELQLPCVIGTGDGTARIRTGDWIRVDGDAGEVTILKPAPEEPE